MRNRIAKSRSTLSIFDRRLTPFPKSARLTDAFCTVIFSLACAMSCVSLFGADWPQAGRTPQHPNFTADSPQAPYECVWAADFSPEFVYSAQPVVAGETLYATTLNGGVYALNVADGERQWHFQAGEAMWGGAAAGTEEYGGAGKVFVASWNGVIYGLDATTGKELWQFDTGEPISGSPCLAQDTLFIGTRRGTMLAVGADGALKWKQPLSWHIYSTAAWNEGKVFVVTEDMYAHCLDAATGRELWTSRKLNGLCLREFYPVVHKGKVLVAVTPSIYHPMGGGLGIELFRYDAVSKELAERCIALNREGKMPEELEAAQEETLEFYRENPEYQTLYVLNESDGKDAFIPMHQYSSGGLQNLWMPPTVCADGTLIVRGGFNNGSRLIRYDLDRNRWIDMLLEFRGTNNDESDYVSAGGDILFSMNYFMGHRILNMNDRTDTRGPGAHPSKVKKVSVKRDVWEVCTPFSGRRMGVSHEHPQCLNGVFPPVIAGKRFFVMDHKQALIAYEGKGE